MMMSELPTVVRVSSKCGFGKPTVSVHKPKQIDPACLLSDPGRDSSTEDSRNTSHYLVRKDNSEIDDDFLNAKLTTSSIYISSILPKIESLQTIIMNGDEDVLSMKQNWL